MTAATAPARRRLSATRATIARRLLEASQTIPHFRLAVEVSAEALLARRSTLATQGGERVTVTDCLVYAASRALLAHRDVNVQFAGEEIAAYDSADVAVAVATPAGLVTPIIRGAHALDLVAISRAVRGLAERARAGTLTREDITGGTFTISNLGMHGVDRFDAIINPPQVAILAAGAVAPRVVARDGRAVVSQQLTLTLSCDHRVIDGAVGAAFLAEVRRRLEAADFA
jgi:pyruvate dehydrogenase E2 component (dihydrolipoamide acetyltransferase)